LSICSHLRGSAMSVYDTIAVPGLRRPGRSKYLGSMMEDHAESCQRGRFQTSSTSRRHISQSYAASKQISRRRFGAFHQIIWTVFHQRQSSFLKTFSHLLHLES
jgi:hypothetical protein